MASARKQRTAAVGVTEHGNSAVLVTVAPGGALLDRRRVDLTQGLTTHPHHHEGSWAVGRYLNTPGARTLSLADAVALVERVRAAAERGAREGLEALAGAVSVPIGRIALRSCPALPRTIEERILDNRAQTFADLDTPMFAEPARAAVDRAPAISAAAMRARNGYQAATRFDERMDDEIAREERISELQRAIIAARRNAG